MEEGEDVWVIDEEQAWVLGTVTSKVSADDGSLTVHVKVEGEEEPRVITAPPEAGGTSASELPEVKAKNEEFMDELTDGRGGVDDLIDLTHLHEPAILNVLQLRFQRDCIYTYTGPILLAVNPFQRLPLYTKSLLEDYYSSGLLSSQGVKVEPLPPHVYATADRSYRNMRDVDDPNRTVDNRNQTLLVSGESGAGKTVTTKIVMQYLATVGRPQSIGSSMTINMNSPRRPRTRTRSRSSVDVPAEETKAPEPKRSGFSVSDVAPAASGSEQPSVEQRVLQSNPILEAFGNAKTLRNENSSRFGKFIELDFNARGHLVGAQIETYLLEKVRLVTQAKGERNYHVFYQLVRGANDEERARWAVTDIEDYHYLNQSGCTTLSDVDDKDELVVTRGAMDVMGVHKPDQEGIFNALAGLLHLGNVAFEPAGDGSEGSRLCDDSAGRMETLCGLLGFDVKEATEALTSKKLYIGSEVTTTVLSPEMATASRDALAKNIYSKMFDWLVSQINTNIKAAEPHATFIGVLDIFGFEHFEHNSFEQLCINYANETLQQQFNEFVFKLEQAEYTREEIEWSSISFEDNKDCLELIEGRKPPGLLALVDEQCLAKGTDQGLARKYYKNLEAHPRFSVTSKQRVNFQFVLRHYAGMVVYDTNGFCEKNMDQLHDEAKHLVRDSSNHVLSNAYAYMAEAVAARRGKPAAGAGAGAGAGGGGGGGGRGKKSQLMSATVGSQFKGQLADLLTVIKATTPHYVRCLKPNPQSAPRLFDRPGIVGQLRCGGVLEAVRVARLGYPVRLPHLMFMSQYRCLVDYATQATLKGKDPRDASRAMVLALGVDPDSFQIGITKVFLKKGGYGELESQRTKCWKAAATTIQAHIRMRQSKLRWHRFMFSVLRLQYRFRRRTALRDTSSRRMQRFMRRQTARARNARARRATIAFQANYRRVLATRVVQKLRIFTRASQIQSVIRMLPKRRLFLQQRKKAVVVQCAARCWLARRKLRRLRREAREVGNLKEQNVELKQRVKQLETEVEQLQAQINELQESKADSGEGPRMPPAPELIALKAQLAAEQKRATKLQEEQQPIPVATQATASPPTTAAVPASTPATPPSPAAGAPPTDAATTEPALATPAGAGVPAATPAVAAPSPAMVAAAAPLEFAARREDQLHAREAQIKRDQVALQKRVARAEKQAAIAASARLKAEKMAEQMQNEIKQLRSGMRKLTADNDAMKRQHHDFEESSTKAYRTQIEAMTEKIASQQQDINELQKEFANQNKALREREELVRRLEIKIQDQDDNIGALEKARAMDSDVKLALAQRLDGALVDQQEAKALAKRLASEKEVMGARIAQLEASLQALEAASKRPAPSPVK